MSFWKVKFADRRDAADAFFDPSTREIYGIPIELRNFTRDGQYLYLKTGANKSDLYEFLGDME